MTGEEIATQLTPKQQAFLAAYAECANITKAAASCGISRQAHQNWMKEHPHYRKAFEDAGSEFADSLQAEATRRGREGVKRIVMYRGEPAMTRDKVTGQWEPLYELVYSDRLLIELLGRWLPEAYRKRSEVIS